MTNKEAPQGHQLFQSKFGLETGAKPFIMGDGKEIEEVKKIEAKNKFNSEIDEYTKKLEDYSAELEEQAKRITENMEGLEILPYGTRLLIKPYNQNPYQKIKVADSGLILDTGGYAPIIKSNETGDFEEERAGIVVGKIIEIGPEVKYMRAGDDVFYRPETSVPVPFFKQGLVSLAENQVVVHVNEKLTDRLISIIGEKEGEKFNIGK